MPRFVASGGGSAYDAVINALSPSARWKLDDTTGTAAVATVGSNGTYNSSPTLGATGLVGDGGTAVTTNGTSSAIELPMPTLGTAGSIILWSAHGAGGADGVPIMRDRTSAGGTGWFIDITGTGGINVRVAGQNHGIASVTASTLRTGARHLYVLTTDGSTVTFYIDSGTPVDSWARSAAFSNISTAFRLGQNGNASQFYGGTFDDFAIVNSVITGTDVANLIAAS